jgi:hypothetical protein
MPVSLDVGNKPSYGGATDPESRFRTPSLFDFIGKAMGGYLLHTSEYDFEEARKLHENPESAYALASKYEPDSYYRSAESQLTSSLFGLPQEEIEDVDRIFDLNRKGDTDIFSISPGEAGQEYQKKLNKYFGKDIEPYESVYRGYLKEGNVEGAEEFLEATRRKKLAKNPDTGELSYKFAEGILGDIYLNPEGEFSDYWNIGLDEGEKLGYGQNWKRALAAPFTKPPTVRGSIGIDAWRYDRESDQFPSKGKKGDDAFFKRLFNKENLEETEDFLLNNWLSEGSLF